MERSRIPLIALVVAAVGLGVAQPVAAAPIGIRNDRSDNALYFEYDSTTGEIPSAYSSRILKPGDRVDFFAYVVERDGAPEGRRLKARIVLRLNHRRAVRYDGRFKFVIEDDTGVRVVKRTRDVNFVLRPRKDHRRRVLRWFFDLDESGTYLAVARFRKDN